MANQKEIFLASEGDAWFSRNKEVVENFDFSANDEIVTCLREIIERSGASTDRPLRILEIGCGDGSRLAYLSRTWPVTAFGVEPSAQAVGVACGRGVNAIQGTADQLPFTNAMFDIVVFGFCLYLSDREDLFRIAQEADRVLKSDAWLVVHDFYSKSPVRREYHHRSGLHTYKMDYRTLFCWHPSYTCYTHRVLHHVNHEYTDEPQEWVATSVIRKCRG
jgi:ubiquinone/menaquinone biosynthesis C-methylase UbiE